MARQKGIKKMNNTKKCEKPLLIECWEKAPIIVNGIIANNFYRTNLVQEMYANKR